MKLNKSKMPHKPVPEYKIIIKTLRPDCYHPVVINLPPQNLRPPTKKIRKEKKQNYKPQTNTIQYVS